MTDPLYTTQAPDDPEEVAPEEEGYSFFRWLFELILLVIVAFAVAYVLKLFIIQPFYIPSGSMEPTLMPGDRVLANKFIYRFAEPEEGEIVVFRAPEDRAQRDFIKRIVATEGQEVEVKGGQLIVDGEVVEEDHVLTVQDDSDYGPVRIPEGSVFVMGDNRTNSSDSRVFGPLSEGQILGKAFIIYWPLRLQTGQERVL